MDTQTRHALKGDKFAQATKTSVTWLSGHRSNVMQWAISAAVVIVVGVGLLIFWNVREAAAETALGQALDTYAAPLALPGGPAQPGSYATFHGSLQGRESAVQGGEPTNMAGCPRAPRRAISSALQTRNWARRPLPRLS